MTALVPLTTAQLGLWHAQQWDRTVPMNVALYVEFDGDVDVELLDRSSRRAGLELQSPFVRFTVVDGEPRQFVDASMDRTLHVVDLREQPDAEAVARAWMADDADRPLDLLGDDLARSTLFRLRGDRWLWYLRAHHAVVYGIGAARLLSRTAELYTAVSTGSHVQQRRSPGIADVVAAERCCRASSRFAKDRRFWSEVLAGSPRPSSLGDHGLRSGAPIRLDAELTQLTSAALGTACNRLDASEAEILVAALAAYVARMTSATEVFVALPVAARTSAMLRRAAGTYPNTVPLRFDISDDVSVGAMVTSARHTIHAALRHQL